MSHHDSSDCPQSHTEPERRPTRQLPRPIRTAGAVTAAVSLAALAAAGGALADAGTTAITAGAVAAPMQASTTTFDAAEALSARQSAAASSSRSGARTAVPAALTVADVPLPPKAKVIGTRYSTVELNVRTKAKSGAKAVGSLDVADKVRITNVTDNGWRLVKFGGELRWVNGSYLSKSKPKPKPTAKKATTTSKSSSSSSGSGSISSAACSTSRGIESGLGANARAVYRAVCARYPQVTSYGGYRPGGGYHGSGRAVDIMISGSTGTQIAAWLRANASRLGIIEVIYAQKIWTTQRASEGWRSMSDRGSVTANHYDHVHVSTR